LRLKVRKPDPGKLSGPFREDRGTLEKREDGRQATDREFSKEGKGSDRKDRSVGMASYR